MGLNHFSTNLAHLYECTERAIELSQVLVLAAASALTEC